MLPVPMSLAQPLLNALSLDTHCNVPAAIAHTRSSLLR